MSCLFVCLCSGVRDSGRMARLNQEGGMPSIPSLTRHVSGPSPSSSPTELDQRDAMRDDVCQVRKPFLCPNVPVSHD